MSKSGSEVRCSFRRVRAARLAFHLAWWLVASSALAQATEDDKRDAARQLAREGFDALDRNEHSVADEKLSRAIALHPAPTLYFARGRARVAVGRWVEASHDFVAAASFASAEGESPAYQRARRDARETLEGLKPRIPTLNLEVAGAPAVQVRVNGTVWPNERLGTAHLVDPGNYRLEVFGAAGQFAARVVTLDEAQHKVERLTLLPPAAQAARAKDQGEPDEPAVPSDSQPVRAVERTSRFARTPVGVWIGMGVTAAFGAAAIATGVRALEKRATYHEQNEPESPYADRAELRSKARAMAWVNTVLAGATLVAGGTTLYVWLRKSESDSSTEARAFGASVQYVY